MKFTLKAMVAALALSAATVPAQAAMESATTNGNGSFVLSVWNDLSGTSATFDLGFNYNTFSSLVSQVSSTPLNLAIGDYADAWSGFVSQSTIGTSNWAIFAGDRLGSVRTANSLGFFTSTNSSDLTNLSTSTDVLQVLSAFDTYINSANGLGNHQAVDNGANTAALESPAGAGSSNAYGTQSKAGGLGPIAGTSFDNSLQMLQVLNKGSAAPVGTFMADASGNNYVFTLSSSGVLNVSSNVTTPVPEADSYAMMMIGLGLVGFVVRRRSN